MSKFVRPLGTPPTEGSCPCCGRRQSELGGGPLFDDGRCRPCHFEYSSDGGPFTLDCGHVGPRQAYDYRRLAERLDGSRPPIELQCPGTTQGVRAMLDVLIEMLPHAAPTPPPRKGSAWIEGYEQASTLARDLLTEVRAGLRVTP